MSGGPVCAVADFITNPGVAIEFQLGNGGRKLQLACGSRRILLHQVGPDIFSFLVGDQAFFTSKSSNAPLSWARARSLPSSKLPIATIEHNFLEKHCSLLCCGRSRGWLSAGEVLIVRGPDYSERSEARERLLQSYDGRSNS